MNAISATDATLPAGALDRLALFSLETGATPPAAILEDHGDGATFSTPFLAYCQQTRLSLDWFYFGTGARTWSEDLA